MKLPSIIEAVEFRREAYGLTQKQWAKVIGIGASHYSEFVNGKRKLTVEQSAKAFEFGVPADCLFQCHPNKDARHIRLLLKNCK